MSTPQPKDLSRRERQVMDALFKLGEGTAEALLEAVPDPPTNSAIRSTLRILVEKGHLRRSLQGRTYLYRPAAQPGRARRSALRGVVETFFEGSAGRAAAALLREQQGSLSQNEIDELQQLIDRARKDGR